MSFTSPFRLGLYSLCLKLFTLSAPDFSRRSDSFFAGVSGTWLVEPFRLEEVDYLWLLILSGKPSLFYLPELDDQAN